jgi:hypothetical protein
MKKIVYALLMALILSGCAMGTTRLDVTHDSLNPVINKRQGNILVERFVDVRENKEFIGNKRNGFGMVLGHVATLEGVSLEDLLTKYFADALTESGYNVQVAGTKSSDMKADAIVVGNIREFWLDLYMKTWHYMTVDLKAIDPSSRKVIWEKEVKGDESNILWIGATSEFERVIRMSLTKALNEAAKQFSADEFSNVVKK